ncbi:aldo-keto reductase [Plectosphaerella plurivora]|uniref:Aldo-keto reductase n=1 Tax=Plectosphaerella plurivora TaxID=936078 RepID=A0A9P9A9K9_9PEZI|nr:aldo-keto reductase [Plectosphaerella plurivora]
MDLPARFTLSNGLQVPFVGLGTFQGDEGNGKVKDAVKLAIRLGYRHIDGASAYGNEKEIGEALNESGVTREELNITSKLAQTWHEPADVEKALDKTLKDLQLNYGKLIVTNISSNYGLTNSGLQPVIDHDLSRRYTVTWAAMEKLVDSGKARSIDKRLSNFNLLKTRRIVEVARITPAVNQVELHPFLSQKELLEYSQSKGIRLMAHQPLGGRPVSVLMFLQIKAVAEQLGMTPAQVCLAWSVQKGVPVVPKSVTEAHLVQNLQLKELPESLFQIVDGLSAAKGHLRFLDPSHHLGFDIFDETEDQPTGNSAPWD